jgi:hypothetical protein
MVPVLLQPPPTDPQEADKLKARGRVFDVFGSGVPLDQPQPRIFAAQGSYGIQDEIPFFFLNVFPQLPTTRPETFGCVGTIQFLAL